MSKRAMIVMAAMVVLGWSCVAVGALTATVEQGSPGDAVDLTGEGTADWAYWWQDSLAKANEKSGAHDISDLSVVGSLGLDLSEWRTRWDVTFSDGVDPENGSVDDVGNRMRISNDPSVDEGYALTVPAGQSVRTLKLYVRNRTTATKFIATLGDETLVTDHNSADDTDYVYTLEFSHATATELEVKWICPVGETSHHSIRMGAATLVGVLVGPVASNPNPADGSPTDIVDSQTLSWTAGNSAASHRVYFSSSFEDVNDRSAGALRASQTATSLGVPEALELGKTYYWAVDEVEADTVTVHAGRIWQLAVNDFISVDDFESYGSLDILGVSGARVWYTWNDGFGWKNISPTNAGNGTGSLVEIGQAYGGEQGLTFIYNNAGTAVNTFDDPIGAYYSRATAQTSSLGIGNDWTQYGVKSLRVRFSGRPAEIGGFVEGPAGTFTITGAGADIWNDSDEFHLGYRMFSGIGSVTAKIESVQEAHAWTKAGLMMRSSLDADSQYVAIYLTGSNGCRVQARLGAGDDAQSDTQLEQVSPGILDEVKAIEPPYWVRLSRAADGTVTASYSADGGDWSPHPWNPGVLDTSSNYYVGMAITSHEPEVPAEAVVSNVSFEGDVSGSWQSQDIGIESNDREPLSVTLKDGGGDEVTIVHSDPNASVGSDWRLWQIALSEFSGAGVDLGDVVSVSIGLGDSGAVSAGGEGVMYFDEVRLHPAECQPSLLKPGADLNGDCLVNGLDLALLGTDWLAGDRTDDGLVAHWKLDGDTLDSSGHGHDGDVNETPITYSAGQVGLAAEFDEANDLIVHDLPLPKQSGTFVHWVMPNQIARMISFYEGSGIENGWTGGDILEIHTGIYNTDDPRWYLCYQDGTGSTARDTMTVDASAEAGSWTHLAVSWDRSGDLIFYADAVEIGRADMTDESFASHDGNYHLIGGPSARGTGRDWLGKIDDVRVYDRALTADEIATVMTGDALADYYYALASQANLSDTEPANSKMVNFRDLAVMADQWGDNLLWPLE